MLAVVDAKAGPLEGHSYARPGPKSAILREPTSSGQEASLAIADGIPRVR